jgi:hypothetical protein
LHRRPIDLAPLIWFVPSPLTSLLHRYSPCDAGAERARRRLALGHKLPTASSSPEFSSSWRAPGRVQFARVQLLVASSPPLPVARDLGTSTSPARSWRSMPLSYSRGRNRSWERRSSSASWLHVSARRVFRLEVELRLFRGEARRAAAFQSYLVCNGVDCWMTNLPCVVVIFKKSRPKKLKAKVSAISIYGTILQRLEYQHCLRFKNAYYLNMHCQLEYQLDFDLLWMQMLCKT